MGTLVLVRHGQASFMAAEYDRLSPVGEEQSRRLGAYWASRGVKLDAVYVGPRERQLRTATLVGEAYRAAGLAWPEPTMLDELDEMQAQLLFQRALPGGSDALATHSRALPEVQQLIASVRAATAPDETRRTFQALFERVMRMWVAGEQPTPDGMEPIETWREFCARVHRTLARMTEGGLHEGQEPKKNRRVVAFTSGGPVAAAVQRALDVPDEATLQLAFAVKNASVSEFLYSRGRFSLSLFNEVAHLDEERLRTYR